LDNMAKLVRGMLHDALDTFVRKTLNNVSETTWLDDDVDHDHEYEYEYEYEYDNILRQLITRMMEDPKKITLTLDVVPTFLPFAKLR
jgi:phosphate uptake regulator